MVENVEDVLGETKPNFTEIFRDVKPPNLQETPFPNEA